MITLAQIEALAAKAFAAGKEFFDNDPAAKQLVTDAQGAISQAKRDGLAASADAIRAGTASLLTGTIGPEAAAAAGQIAANAVMAEADALTAPVAANAVMAEADALTAPVAVQPPPPPPPPASDDEPLTPPSQD